ncbi:MAG: 5-methyltetrahydrofolate--homocysteine methyltransferase [Lentisphaerae bacterium]|nr:5-methyltetrahydrofolate--homocysteine methyltransferase [Lentisphaerota bacterium]
MTRQKFRAWCSEAVRILDGATGTELIKQGMPGGVAPELWVMEHPESITAVQQAYAAAGSNIVYSATFGGNEIKLAEFGLAGRAFEINKKLAEISCAAVRNQGVLVFGDMAPTGRFVEPSGDWNFEEAVTVFKHQAEALAAGGVDGFVIETMMDLQEARAALIAVRELFPDAPVMVTLTFDSSQRTLTGVTPEAALITLQSLGADAFGCNCSTGPGDMAKLIKKLQPYAEIPLIAKPNAGLPILKDGKTIFNMNENMFAGYVDELLQCGVNLLGGCCGTTPKHIAAAAQAVKKSSVQRPARGSGKGIICSNRKIRLLSPSEKFIIIGERINPTGKKALQAELRENSMNLVLQFALEQQAAGAQVLDVNMGLSGVDETALMCKALSQVVRAVDTPLCIDSTSPETVEKALRIYPGRALLNSISLEKERIEKVLPVAAKYGAMLILLPLDDNTLPADCAGRKAILSSLLAEVQKYGYILDDVAVDALVMAVSAAPQAGNGALEFIDYCHNELKVNTVCGLSNISFGLPNRMLLNRTFLVMAMARGLNMAIANCMNSDFMDAVLAVEALNGMDEKVTAYLQKQTAAATVASAPVVDKKDLPPNEAAYTAILRGDAPGAVKAVQKAVSEPDCNCKSLLDDFLLRAIAEVGRKFEAKEYFLPQLLSGAEALQASIAELEPYLQDAGQSDSVREKFIIATVKGDIHDIGKNIAALMLRNSNFEVIDLGKDVPAEVIVRRAQEENCHLIGLSALMTTTMSEMPQVIELARRESLDADFIVGGAVVDENFAQEIGAAYAADAMMAVRVARALADKRNGNTARLVL